MISPNTSSSALAPVEILPTDEETPPAPGTALCLSGGGSRAMLFHAGGIVRLNELGLLARLGRVSSVSGGSIIGGLLARRWSELAFDASGRSPHVDDLIVQPLRELARHRIDRLTYVIGTLLPGTTPAERFADVLDEHLYGGISLAAIPATPRFVINATNIATGVLFRFSQPYLGDYTIGRVANPTVRLATAVAASSAFPPFFSPLRLDLSDASWITDPGNDPPDRLPPFRRRPALGDGGMYDNLGLETAWKSYRTILVSDGGGTLKPDPNPPGGFVWQSIRITQVIDRQVRALRKRLLIDGYKAQIRDGAYWGIRSDIAAFPGQGHLPCPTDATLRLADEPTRLTRMPESTMERLINWGYAVADASLRAHVSPTADPPAGFPYPATGVG